MTMIEECLVALTEERKCYVDRLLCLISGAGHETEIAGYLNMINKLNDAAIRLARFSFEEQSCSQTTIGEGAPRRWAADVSPEMSRRISPQ
jgi:hypothetical protein